MLAKRPMLPRSPKSAVKAVGSKQLRKRTKGWTKTKTFAYALGGLIAGALLGLLGLLNISNPLLFFIGFQLYFLLFGIAHLVLMYRILPWADPDRFWKELLFSMLLILLGGLGFWLIFKWMNGATYALLFATSTFVFILPYMFWKMADYAIAIPPKEYKKWQHPVEGAVPEIDLSKKHFMISFKLAKNVSQENSPRFRVMTNGTVTLGELFHSFIFDYNAEPQHGSDPITYIDPDDNEPYEWHFKKKTWWGGKTYLDHELSIDKNGLHEKDTVFAIRVEKPKLNVEYIHSENEENED